MSFESKITPDRVQATHIKEGFLMGWIPGVITSLDDPEKIGRVQVKCSLLSESNMPNQEDSWVWVGEEFTANGTPGGSQRPLALGSLVALIPMMGDPRQLLLFCCLPNRQDRPHPDFDRSVGVTGKASLGGTIEIDNDNDGSWFKKFPSNAVQSVGGDGSILYESPGKARFHLMTDGSASLENENASFTASPEGNLSARSLGGAALNLNKDGTLTVSAGEKASLTLNSKNAHLEGPVRSYSALLLQARGFLSTDLKQGVELLKKLEKLVKNFESGSFGTSHYVYESNSLLQKLSDGIGKNLPKGITILEELKAIPPLTLGESLDGQLKEGLRIELDKIVKLANEVVQKNKPGKAIISETKGKIPKDLKKLIALLDEEEKKALYSRLDAIIPTLDALYYDVVLQKEALIAEIVPNGWSSIDAIVKMRLHGNIKGLEDVINPKPERLEKFTIKEEGKWWDDLPARVKGAIGQLGEYSEFAKGDMSIYDLHKGDETLTEQAVSRIFSAQTIKSAKFLTKEELADKDREAKQIEEDKKLLKKLVPGESPLPTLFGEVFQNLIKKTEKTLSAIKKGEKGVQGIAPLGKLAFILMSDDVLFNKQILVEPLKEVSKHFSVGGESGGDILQNSIEKVLPKSSMELVKNLIPILESAISDFDKLIRAIPDEPKGAAITAREEYVQMQTSRGDKGAVARIGKDGAQLMGPEFAPNLRVSLFADKAEAGMQGGLKGGVMRVERRMAELLGPERKDGELPKRDEDAPGKGKKGGYKIFSEGQRRKQGGDQEKAKKEPKYDDLPEKERMVRTSIFGDAYGGAGMLSGGRGAGTIVHLQKAETFGPEIEIDGKKLRTGSFVFAQEAGSAAADGAISYVGRDRAEVLGPEREEGEYKDEQDDQPHSDKGGFDFDLKPIKFKKGGDREEGKPGKFEDAQAKKKLRTCFFAERTGLIGGKSGGSGACFSADENKSGMHGPEIEIDGKKTRSGMHAASEETAIFAPGNGAMSIVGANRAEVLGPIREDGIHKDDDTEPESDLGGFIFNPFEDWLMEKGGKPVSEEKEKPENSSLRTSLFAEKGGTAGMKSGGTGALAFVDPIKSGMFGPEIEIDGEKARTQLFTWAKEAGIKGPGTKAAIHYVGEKIGELLGPQVEDALGELIRTNIFADEVSATVWAGGSEGAMTIVTQELAKMLGPAGKGLLNLVKDYSQFIGADGISNLKLAEAAAELFGPDGKKALQIAQEYLKLTGPGFSVLNLAENVAKLLGPDGEKALYLAQDYLQLIGPGLSTLKLAEKVSELFGPDGKKALRIAEDYLKLLGPGSSSIDLASKALSILGIDGKSGIQMLEGATKIFGPGGKVSLNLGIDKMISKGLGGLLSMGGNGTAISSIGHTIFRNGSTDGSKGVGMFLDPNNGMLSLSSFFPGEHNVPPASSDDDLKEGSPETPPDWSNQSARIALQDNTVHIQSLSPEGNSSNEITCSQDAIHIQGKDIRIRVLSDSKDSSGDPKVSHEIKIDKDGIKFDDKDIASLFDLESIISSILARLMILESSSSRGNTP